MYICPTCNKEFKEENMIQQHFLSCWKEQHPYHKSKPAPRGKDINISKGSENILNFLKEVEYGRSKN